MMPLQYVNVEELVRFFWVAAGRKRLLGSMATLPQDGDRKENHDCHEWEQEGKRQQPVATVEQPRGNAVARKHDRPHKNRVWILADVPAKGCRNHRTGDRQ